MESVDRIRDPAIRILPVLGFRFPRSYFLVSSPVFHLLPDDYDGMFRMGSLFLLLVFIHRLHITYSYSRA